MKLYKIIISYHPKYNQKSKVKKFKNGKEFQNVREYFLKDNFIRYIDGYDKQNRHIYVELRNKQFNKFYYDKKDNYIYLKDEKNKIIIAHQKYYNLYIKEKQLEYKRNKLNKILNIKD